MEELFSAAGGSISVGALLLWLFKYKVAKFDKEISEIKQELIKRDLAHQKEMSQQEETNALQEKDIEYLKDKIKSTL